MAAAVTEPRGKRVLSGTQPTGVLHLGNYFGSIRQKVRLQQHNQGCYFIADLHSMNEVRDGGARRGFSHELALDFLALGLDPERSVLYRQSDLPEVAELSWILTTVTPMGLLQRAHSYKDALAAGEKPDHGLLAYPVLMSADILIQSAEVVPVGQDQKQHLEVARDIAVKFNATYGELLTLPDAYILEEVALIPGTDGRKMSKSYGNGIQPFAGKSALRRQVMGIVTDSTPVEQPKDPDASTLFELWALFAVGCEREAMAERFRAGGVGYGEVKKELLERVMDYFGPARAAREKLAADPEGVEAILRDGARRARDSAAPLMDAVRSACGIGTPR